MSAPTCALLRAERRTSARDRRAAAVHEAGHVVVARHVCLQIGAAWIAPTNTANVRAEAAWTGHTTYALHGFNRLSGIRRAMFAVAGIVAECTWTGRDGLACWNDVLCDPAAMSLTDWAGAGCLPGEPTRETIRACERVELLLSPTAGPLWPALLREARRLIVDATRASTTEAPQ